MTDSTEQKIIKKLNNGLEITIRQFNPYGMWRIGYDSFGRNKRTIASFCAGEFTSSEMAEKAIKLFLDKEGLKVISSESISA